MYAREYVRIDVRVKMCADAAIHGVHSLKETFHTKSMCIVPVPFAAAPTTLAAFIFFWEGSPAATAACEPSGKVGTSPRTRTDMIAN